MQLLIILIIYWH